jgi:hypothetical protein
LNGHLLCSLNNLIRNIKTLIFQASPHACWTALTATVTASLFTGIYTYQKYTSSLLRERNSVRLYFVAHMPENTYPFCHPTGSRTSSPLTAKSIHRLLFIYCATVDKMWQRRLPDSKRILIQHRDARSSSHYILTSHSFLQSQSLLQF